MKYVVTIGTKELKDIVISHLENTTNSGYIDRDKADVRIRIPSLNTEHTGFEVTAVFTDETEPDY